MNADKIKIEASWKKVLAEEFRKPYFKDIVKHLKDLKSNGADVYPPGPLIFNAFNATPLDQLKVVILGQDPYHNPGEAMGLCFSVPKGVRLPPSLKNVFREIKEDIGIELPDHGDLSSWTHQGVFLLNAMLTVEHKKAGSHSKIGWQTFTNEVISKISEYKKGIVFLLWGNFAKSKSTLIDPEKHLILESAHPSPLAGKRFFGNHHFSRANEYLMKQGKTPIQWQT